MAPIRQRTSDMDDAFQKVAQVSARSASAEAQDAFEARRSAAMCCDAMPGCDDRPHRGADACMGRATQLGSRLVRTMADHCTGGAPEATVNATADPRCPSVVQVEGARTLWWIAPCTVVGAGASTNSVDRITVASPVLVVVVVLVVAPSMPHEAEVGTANDVLKRGSRW